MTPSQKAKELGCKSLAQVSRESGQSEQTLINWFKNKPQLFELVCRGINEKLANQESTKKSRTDNSNVHGEAQPQS